MSLCPFPTTITITPRAPPFSKVSLMMAIGGSECIQENIGKFIYLLQPKIKSLVRKLERILVNYIDASLLSDQFSLSKGLLLHTHTHT